MDNAFIIGISRILSSESSLYLALTDGESERVLPIEHYESTLIAYHYTEFADFSHIKTIYQIFLSFLKSSEYSLDKCHISSYDNGIGYCKITLIKKDKPIFFLTTISDGFVFSLMENVPMTCDYDAWENFDPITNEFETLD